MEINFKKKIQIFAKISKTPFKHRAAIGNQLQQYTTTHMHTANKNYYKFLLFKRRKNK